MINSFEDKYQFLSNFYPCRIYYRGKPFPSVEHAYQASKGYNDNTINLISNLKPGAAGLAKYIGNNAKQTILRKDWQQVKLSIMEFLLRQKFEQLSLKNKLIDTGFKQLIEGNFWHDNYWGDCQCKKCKNIVGENNLGKLLMLIRSGL